MTQRHPIFDFLLRTALEDYYEVQTNVPVSDLPREADIVLVRRTGKVNPPFKSVWHHLCRYNVLEFKGASDSARIEHIDQLVEVGLGIHRRLQESEPKERIPCNAISFWYLANHLGHRLQTTIEKRVGALTNVSEGIYRCKILGRALWFVSNRDVPIDAESAPLRMVSEQSAADAMKVAKVTIVDEKSWNIYGPILGALFPSLKMELYEMAAKRAKRELTWSLVLENALADSTPKQLIEDGNLKRIVDKIGPEGLLALLSPAQKKELEKRLTSEK